MVNKNEVGKDTEVVVDGNTVVYTTATYELQYDTADSDMNDEIRPYTAVVSRYLEGTLEWDGSQIEAHEVFMDSEGNQHEDIMIRMQDTEKTMVAEEITIQNLSREFPADDKTNGSIDFKADDFYRE